MVIRIQSWNQFFVVVVSWSCYYLLCDFIYNSGIFLLRFITHLLITLSHNLPHTQWYWTDFIPLVTFLNKSQYNICKNTNIQPIIVQNKPTLLLHKRSIILITTMKWVTKIDTKTNIILKDIWPYYSLLNNIFCQKYLNKCNTENLHIPNII